MEISERGNHFCGPLGLRRALEDTKTLRVHHDDLAPNRYHAFELWGVSKAAKELRNSIGDAYVK